MKKQHLFAGIFMFCCITFSVMSCADSPSEQRKEADKALQDAKENVQEAKEDLKDASHEAANALRVERDSLSAKMARTGRELDAEIAALDKKIDKAKAKEKVRWQERRQKLVAEREELNADMKRMGEEMKDDWNDFKMAVAKKLDQISDDLKSDK